MLSEPGERFVDVVHGEHDSQVAESVHRGVPAAPVAELNDPGANDIQPNVRKDGREVVFSSNRAGTLGGQDIWVATRNSLRDPWSAPVNLGASVNTTAAETRPSLARGAETLLFGRAPGPEGMSDIYMATRDKLGGSDDDGDEDEGDDDE